MKFSSVLHPLIFLYWFSPIDGGKVYYRPRFNCQHFVLTSTGEALSNFVQCVALILELQTLASRRLNQTLPVVIEIPFVGSGEWDRSSVKEKIWLDKLLYLSSSTSVSFIKEIYNSSMETLISATPIILGWENLSIKEFSNKIPLPWSSRHLTQVRTRSKNLAGESLDYFLDILLSLSDNNQTKYLFRVEGGTTGPLYFTQTAYYNTLQLISFYPPIYNSSNYTSRGLHEKCAYVFFRRPFILEDENETVLVDMTCNQVNPSKPQLIQWPLGQAICSRKVLLSDYAQLVASELIERNISCAGVNMNEFTNWGKSRRALRKQGHRAPRGPRGPPLSQYKIMSEQIRRVVLSALMDGADKAQKLHPSSSTLVDFHLDIGREPGTVGNVRQMHLAHNTPLLVTEAGTQWTDVLLASRIVHNMSTIVIHPPGYCDDDVTDTEKLFFERICYNPKLCEQCWFYRGFCIYGPDESHVNQKLHHRYHLFDNN